MYSTGGKKIMNKYQFLNTYCLYCGTQRCEGVDSALFEGCIHKDELDELQEKENNEV